MPSNDTENIYSTQFNEGEAQPIPATRIGYDNVTSGLDATNVQEAIDEIADDVKGLILAKIHTIEVTAENDTIDSLLVKLYEALLADKEAQPSDYYHYVSGITLTGYATLKNLASGIRVHSSGIAYNYFGARLPSSNEMQIAYVEHKSAGNVVLKAKLLNDGTFTLANEKSNTLSDGTTFIGVIEYYKQNE